MPRTALELPLLASRAPRRSVCAAAHDFLWRDHGRPSPQLLRQPPDVLYMAAAIGGIGPRASCGTFYVDNALTWFSDHTDSLLA